MSRGSPKSHRQRRALTLVECLVASLLLALGASAAMIAMSASLQLQKFSGEERTAAELGRQLLEELTALAYIDPGSRGSELRDPCAFGSAGDERVHGYRGRDGPGGSR
jgi:prepilin-type N-terminal cleavage/methylation domain-containing protein